MKIDWDGKPGELFDNLLGIHFKVKDTRGGYSVKSPSWQMCNCQNDGLCNFDSVRESTGRISVCVFDV